MNKNDIDMINSTVEITITKLSFSVKQKDLVKY